MIINRLTGKEPTKKEMDLIRQRAIQIFRNPYSSPELMSWAVSVYPEGMVEVFETRNTKADE